MVLKRNLKLILSNCFSILVLLSLQCDYFHVAIIWRSDNWSIVCLYFAGIRNNLIDIVSKAIFSYLSQGTVVFCLGAGARCFMVRTLLSNKRGTPSNVLDLVLLLTCLLFCPSFKEEFKCYYCVAGNEKTCENQEEVCTQQNYVCMTYTQIGYIEKRCVHIEEYNGLKDICDATNDCEVSYCTQSLCNWALQAFLAD